jgi:hypothetical protein
LVVIIADHESACPGVQEQQGQSHGQLGE